MRFPRPPAPLRLIILLFIIVRVHLAIGAVCGPPTDVIDVFANGVSFLIRASAPPLCSPCFRSPSLLPLHWCVLVQPRVPFPMVFLFSTGRWLQINFGPRNNLGAPGKPGPGHCGLYHILGTCYRTQELSGEAPDLGRHAQPVTRPRGREASCA